MCRSVVSIKVWLPVVVNGILVGCQDAVSGMDEKYVHGPTQGRFQVDFDAWLRQI